jgi:hypothetical protein
LTIVFIGGQWSKKTANGRRSMVDGQKKQPMVGGQWSMVKKTANGRRSMVDGQKNSQWSAVNGRLSETIVKQPPISPTRKL